MIVHFQMDKEKGDLIREVKTTLTTDGKRAQVTYQMPFHEIYHYCVIFDVSEEAYGKGIKLSDLIASADMGIVDIIDSKMPHDHTVALTRDGKRSLFFGARKEGGTYFLRDQKEGNVSACLKMKPSIRCAVRYEAIRKGMFGLCSAQYQKVFLKFGGDRPMQGTYLTYWCKGGGRENVRFGIDLAAFWKQEMQITIKKGERLELVGPEDLSLKVESV